MPWHRDAAVRRRHRRLAPRVIVRPPQGGRDDLCVAVGLAGHPALAAVRQRLHAAARVEEAVLAALRRKRAAGMAQLLGELPADSAPPVAEPVSRPAEPCLSAALLYLPNRDAFSGDLSVEGQDQSVDALLRLYDDEMAERVRRVRDGIGSFLTASGPAHDARSWLLVLPLLWAADGRRAVDWSEAIAPVVDDAESVSLLTECCLQDLGEVPAAVGLAEWPARRAGTDFDAVAHCLALADTMVAKGRPDVAWAALAHAARCRGWDTAQAASLRLRMAKTALTAGDPERAMDVCGEVSAELAGQPAAAEAAYYRLVCLSKLGRGDDLLAELSALLDRPDLVARRAELLYLRWWGEVTTGTPDAARAAADVLLADHGDDVVVAPVLFWTGAQNLAAGDYVAAREALAEITHRFPQSASAGEAKDLLAKLVRAP